MIKINNDVIHLNTESSSYIFCVNKHRDLQHLYYGSRLDFMDDYSALIPRRSVLLVNGLYPASDITYGIDDISFEYSCSHTGDMRDCALEIADGNNRVFTFKYNDCEIGGVLDYGHNAHSYGFDDSLCVTMKEQSREVYLKLWYFVYEKSNVITRCAQLINNTVENINVEKLMSVQLDFADSDYKILTFDGAWCRERTKIERPASCGKFVIESQSGLSSARHNPYIMLAKENCNNSQGDCFGFNMIYSGNHYESVEVCPYEHTRVMSGINPMGFGYEITPNQSFVTPEAVMSYSENGYNGVSQNMHNFVNDNIVRGYWKRRERPILVNSWEAMYFDINEQKLLELADNSKRLGVELLVIDDGWFGKRNDDTTSLGDWNVNTSKFPSGLDYLSRQIHDMGLLFGLWLEPEMVCEKSEFYTTHPDWVFKPKGGDDIVGRGQYIIDLSNTEAQQYLIDTISEVIAENGVDYIKWDCNRHFSFIQSNKCKSNEILHRYILGLYNIMDSVTRKFPKLLIEFCSGGGNRYDLGVMCYCPIGWVSDNTDVLSRSYVQEGTSYGYPQSTMCNHISTVPNHQTKRISPLTSRCEIASFGIMGCQLDLTKLPEVEKTVIKSYIDNYKQDRNLYQFGTFFRLLDGMNNNANSWLVVGENQEKAKLFVLNKLFNPVTKTLILRLDGINPNYKYLITEQRSDDVKPFTIISDGATLMKNGFILPQNYQGNERYENTRMLMDFSTIIYDIRKI